MPSDSTVFVDTNVLLYALDPRDAAKQRSAQGWLQHCWRHDCGRVSTQVLHELYANLRRVAPSLPADEARRIVREYRAWTPWVVDDETVDTAWDLQDRFGFGFQLLNSFTKVYLPLVQVHQAIGQLFYFAHYVRGYQYQLTLCFCLYYFCF